MLNCSFIQPSAAPDLRWLPGRLEQMNRSSSIGLKSFSPLSTDTQFPFYASVSDRCQQITEALGSDYIWSVRGGYGCVDLLEFMISNLKHEQENVFIGFSDMSSILASAYARFGYLGWHASMPGGKFWNDDLKVDEFLRQLSSQRWAGSIELLKQETSLHRKIEGILFGGCFSVLTNLIGTSYFPKTLKGHILMLEDIGEHPARLMRYWHQWESSGVLEGLEAIVLGRFVYEGSYGAYEDLFRDAVSKRSKTPVFWSNEFGHSSANQEFVVGAQASIDGCNLTFSCDNPVFKGGKN